ncbi:hypothetical protein [Pannonibacter sp. SL95]|uniref:hypothetical protein n=1 Tax=Pannonibacter sp. SL95 TaxID=2995153 RepID=UPI0022747054|nr:hypothetical protein [Pannonibacter sp. SL95]MCY1705509.1 hypothetical protein [Pannonibacter sp. SL95]
MKAKRHLRGAEKVQYLRDLIEWVNFELDRSDANTVIHHMEFLEGAKIGFSGGAYVLRCGGVGASCTQAGTPLLKGWVRAANRSIDRLNQQLGAQ